MQYFLGVDIGGTKSHALITDARGHALGFGEGGPGNYESVGWEGLRAMLHHVTERALVAAGIAKAQIAGAGFGVAGYDWPAEHAPTEEAIASLGLSAPFAFVNDTIIGLLAGTTQGWGVAVVAGTSNNCWGRDRQGHEGRVTGCGPVFGEYGGGGELVARAVQAVAKAWTRRGPPTRMSEAFIELTGATDVVDFLEGLVLRRYTLSPSAAPLVFQVAAEGDAVARETIQWAGQELGSLAVGVIRQLGFEDLPVEVVLTGSLYEGGPLLTDAMQATIQAVAPQARLVRLSAPPVVGGVLLGMEQAGLDYARLRPAVVESTRKLLGAT